MVNEDQPAANPIPFKAETRQMLDILIHSLYTERSVFLRELISNASDALSRINFEMLTNHNVLDADAEPGIWIRWDEKEKTITVKDTGIGMNAAELEENLGTIAHSGARAFVQAAKDYQGNIADIIGQFGVGFYSSFMVADWIRVTSRSYRPGEPAAAWSSTGADTFTLEQDEKKERGTEVTIKLKADAEEFANEHRLREVIKRHSDFIPFPIYLGEGKEQVNQQTALWRKAPRDTGEDEYKDFYNQFTLDPEAPLTHAHMVVDAPYQMYALLYIPASPERTFFSLRKQDGIKLYARKVLIQEYNNDLLPEYYRFVQGVVDSEDIPLNVSREAIQSNRVLLHLKKVLTSKVTDTLISLSQKDSGDYEKFWLAFAPFIKEGVASDVENSESLYPLLRYHTLNAPGEWQSLAGYVDKMKPDQKKIYYLLGDDERAIINSPHLEIFRQLDYDVLFMTDPIDAFTLLRLTRFQDLELANAAKEEIKAPGEAATTDELNTAEEVPSAQVLVDRFKEKLGERVKGARVTTRLVESPARLVDAEGSPNEEIQRVYRMLKKDYEVPLKVLEINPQHPLMKKLAGLESSDPRSLRIIEQVFENALLIEGLHPNPADMINRIQKIMEDALE